MTNLSREDEILLREYQEAGEACRSHDQLIRTGLGIFGAVQAAIIGFIGTVSVGSHFELALLEILGFVLSIVVLLTTLRLQHRYATYVQRAKCIETRLGMCLYNCSEEWFYIARDRIPAGWAGNKVLWASVPFTTMVLYSLLLYRDGPVAFVRLVLGIDLP